MPDESDMESVDSMGSMDSKESGEKMASRVGVEGRDDIEPGGRRKLTLRDIIVAFFMLLTTGLMIGILLEGFLSA